MITISEDSEFAPRPAAGRPTDVINIEPVRQVWRYYTHTASGTKMRISQAVALNWACDPGYYSEAYCTGIDDYFPVSNFFWSDSVDHAVVGT